MTTSQSVPHAVFADAAARSMRPCPVCHSPAARTLHCQAFALFDDSALPAETRVVACEECGAVYAAATASADDYRRHYERHSKYETVARASGSGETASDAARLDALVAWLAPRIVDRIATRTAQTPSIVDVGAARGGLLQAFIRQGYTNGVGIDPSDGCVAAMRGAGLRAVPGHLDQDVWATDPRRFDLVVLSHVLEHVYDVSGAFERVARRVARGGRIYVEVPDATRYDVDGFPPFYFFDPEHINHFDAALLERLAGRHGWALEAVWPRMLDLGTGQRYPALGALLVRRERAVAPVVAKAAPPLAAAIESYVARSRDAVQASVDAATLAALALERTPVVLWGAGSHAQRLLAQTPLRRCAIDCIIDGDSGKQGRRLAGHRVVPPDVGVARAAATSACVVVAIAVGGNVVGDRLPPATRVIRL